MNFYEWWIFIVEHLLSTNNPLINFYYARIRMVEYRGIAEIEFCTPPLPS